MLSLKKQECFRTFLYPVTMKYGKRLEKALEMAGKDRQALAAALGISPQAVGQVITGGRSGVQAFTAENSARAAKFLGVNHFWLATGEGSAQLEGSDWPFQFVDRERYESLTPDQRTFVQGGLDSLIKAQEELGSHKANGTQNK